MDDIKRILVVSRSTKYCKKAVHYGIALAKCHGAELYLLHILPNCLGLESFDIPLVGVPNLKEEYRKAQHQAKEKIDKIIEAEKASGMRVHVIVKEGHPNEEIFSIIKNEKIDLLILLGHSEWRLEHFLFGRSNDEILRKMPCSVMFLKQEPEPVGY